jgi:lysozyme
MSIDRRALLPATVALTVALASGAAYEFVRPYEGTGPQVTASAPIERIERIERATPLPPAPGVDEQTLALIRRDSGLRLAAYRDPGGVVTICYGHTGPEVKMGDTKTLAECDALLAADYERIVRPAFKSILVPITARQAVGLGDFIYNVGGGAFQRSTLLRKLNAGQCRAAAAELHRWVYQGKKKLNGLVTRRAGEYTYVVEDCTR